MHIGIIGLGHIATNAHIPAIKRIKEAKLVAIADVDEKKLVSAKRKLGSSVKYFTDYNDMLKQPEIDIATICLPPQLHGKATLDALKAGKHVLVEKPLSTSLNEAYEVAKLSKEVNRKVCVVQNYRFFPAVLEAKKMIQEEIIGKVIYINTRAYVPPPTVQLQKAWIYGPWGILDDYGPHPIDMTNWLMASTPTTVYCTRGAMDKAESVLDARITVKYQNSSVASINLSWLAGATKFELEITGTAGEIILNVNLNQFIKHHGTITPYNQIKDSLSIAKMNIKNILKGTIFKGSYIYHSQLLREFIESIRKNLEPPVSLTESLRNIMVAEGAKISLKEGKMINLNELPVVKSSFSLINI